MRKEASFQVINQEQKLEFGDMVQPLPFLANFAASYFAQDGVCRCDIH
jgi:hypothetical protein